MTVAAVRTPDERFESIPDFDYPVSYSENLPGYEGLRAAWVDAGPADADRVYLCLHGEPSWSFLYRRMMPTFLKTGARVVAPDLFGFGRSDKPIEAETYTFDFHRGHLLALVRHLDLKNITLVVQDWGGILGLTLPVDPDFRPRLSRLLVMNTALGTGELPSEGFLGWRDYVRTTDDLPVGGLMERGMPHLSKAEIAAYDAPFPSKKYKMGTLRFPELVPISPEMDGVALSFEAAEYWKNEFDGSSFMAVGDADPVLGPPVMAKLREGIRGCPEPMIIEGGGHFVQEWGEQIAEAAVRHFGD
jgi:pimeloyl-ACP methyl ester carboxylesterase